FHLSRVQSTRDQHLELALALVRKLEMSGRDLRALRRLPSRRKFVALSGQRIGVRTLSGSDGGRSEYAGRRGRPPLDRDACRGPGSVSNSKTHVLGRARIERTGPRGSIWAGAQIP